MDPSRRFFEDMAKAAGGAASALSGVRAEVETLVRHRVERLLGDLDIVRRDEFEAVKAMAAKARAGEKELSRRIGALEAKLGIKPKKTPRPRTGTKAKPKATAKKRPASSSTPASSSEKKPSA